MCGQVFAVQNLNFRFYLLLSLIRMMQQQHSIEMNGVSDQRVLYSFYVFLNAFKLDSAFNFMCENKQCLIKSMQISISCLEIHETLLLEVLWKCSSWDSINAFSILSVALGLEKRGWWRPRGENKKNENCASTLCFNSCHRNV